MTRQAISPELATVTPQLIAAGFNVYVCVPTWEHVPVSWVIVERGGNTCTLEYDRISGYRVHASVASNRNHGSSVLVDIIGDDVVDACTRGTLPLVQVRFCKDNPVVPNNGMRHFSWCPLNVVV